jgi:hypothetical protein
MVVAPAAVGRVQKRFNGVFIAGGITARLAAGAHARVRLDMGAGRNLLEENLDRFGAFGALEGQDAGWFGHDSDQGVKNAHFIIAPRWSTEAPHQR